MSLGCGREHVMDAISNCEQYAKEQGGNDRNAPWKLFFRKEMFAPWYNPSGDPVATDLIYRQVVRGINFGEYQCKSDKDIAILSALQYYAEHGSDIDEGQVRQTLGDYLSKDVLGQGAGAEDKWTKLIMEALHRCSYVKDRADPLLAKEDIVVFAQLNWPMMFSRFFETVRTGGPEFSTNNIILAINWTGIFFISEQEQVLVSSVGDIN